VERRGFLTWAAVGLVVVVGLLAIADAVRGLGDRVDPAGEPVAVTSVTTTSAADAVREPASAPADWEAGRLDGVLTFVDAEDCTLRSIDLATGRELPLDRFETACAGFWAPLVTQRLAFVEPFADGMTTRFVDLDDGADLGRFTGGGDIHWSLDGERAAWCTGQMPSRGLELEVPDEARPVQVCPVAYTEDGRMAEARFDRLIVGGETVARMPSPISFVQYASDGGFVVADFRGRIRRFGPRPLRLGHVPGWNGVQPVFSADLCRAVFPRVLGFTEVELGCDGGVTDLQLPGVAAAWSPDGQWLAVAVPGEIRFYAAAFPFPRISWPARALALAWRS
jgi:hypothetical protein